MKTKKATTLIALIVLAVCALPTENLFAQGSTFTYQGRLIESGTPASGTYELRFAIYDVASGGNSIAGPLTNSAVTVNQGLFAATLDFGATVFSGSPRWLEIGVRTNGGGAFTDINPRQLLAATPYAIVAGDVTGSNIARLASSNYFPGVNFLTNSANIIVGDGTGLSGIWKLGGNAGANPATGNFLGTTDNQPLELRVNGSRTLRLEPNNSGAPNIIGGSANNFVTGGVVGATIGGGGANNYLGNHYTNSVTGAFGTVSGGGQNIAGPSAVAGGGEQNTSSGGYAAIGGGYQNKASQTGSAIAGGVQNSVEINGVESVVAGGFGNTNRGPYSAIGGGQYSLIHSNAYFATIGGGAYNGIGTNSSSTTISGGYDNTIFENSVDVAIGGGSYNSVGTNSQYSVIGGGRINTIAANSSSSSIGGGFVNKIDSNSSYSTIPGGQNNLIGSSYGFVGGGATNIVQPFSPYSFIGAGLNNTIQGNFNVVAGGEGNQLSQTGATISGGLLNTNWSYSGAVAGGAQNIANGSFNTVGGGYVNQAVGNTTTVAGGYTNRATGDYSTIAGGQNNSVTGLDSAIGGGNGNTVNGPRAVIGGGFFNTASGNAATVPGGSGNVASGTASFAAGRQASAAHDGSFVWADLNGAFSSTAPNQFAVHASGGVRLNGDVTLEGGYRRLEMTGGNAFGYLYGSFPALGDGIHLAYNHYYDAGGGGHVSNTGGQTSRVSLGYGSVGVYISTGANQAPTVQRILANSTGVTVNGTFNNSSDRNAKQDFKQVDASKILAKVAQLPLTEWSYKEDPNTRHIGPMGQDFYSLFNIGTDEKHIAPIDEGGVALAAIQALNQKLEERDTRVTALEKEVAELKKLLLRQSKED